MKLTTENVAIGIERRLQEEIVNFGYYPDESTFTTLADFQAAKQAIRDSGKELIVLKGMGDYESRGKRVSNQITIDYRYQRNSGAGSVPNPEYVKVGDKYEVSITHNGLSNLYFQINFFTKSATYASKIEEIINAAFDKRVLLYGLDRELNRVGDPFNFEYDTQYDKTDSVFIVKTYIYIAVNVDVKGNKPDGEVSELKEFITELTDLDNNLLNS